MSVATRVAPTLLACALVAPGFGGAARAAVSPVEADALQGQLRAWIAGLLGPAVDLGNRAVRVTPEGDRYRLELPLAGPAGDTGTAIRAAPVTALARPIEGGRWNVEQLRLPSPLHVDGTTDAGEKRSWTLKFGAQDTHGTLDPTLATTSSFDSDLRDYKSDVRTGERTQSTHLDRTVWHNSWEPVGEGRVTLRGEAQGENLTVTTATTDRRGSHAGVTVSSASLHSTGVVERVAFDRLGLVIRTLSGLLPSAMAAVNDDSGPGELTAEDRAGLRTLLNSGRDLLSRARQETTLERVRIDADGQGGTVAKVTIGGTTAAAAGKLDATLLVALDGIDTPVLPQGPLRDYLPRRIAFRPHVSDIPIDALIKLLLRGVDGEDPDVLQAEAGKLLEANPVKATLDEFVLDLGPATVRATAATTMLRPDALAGTVNITATGLDALIRRANTVPELRSAAPMLIFLKGLGDQEGDATTWAVVYADGKATVNGTDFGALMAPAAAPAGKPSSTRPRERAR